MNQQIHTLKQKTQEINAEIYTLYLSYRDHRVKWYVRLLLAFVIGYALSPIDLVPDLVPVFGFLDDIVILTLGTSLSYQLLTKSIISESRIQAYENMYGNQDSSSFAYRVIGYTWLIALTIVGIFFYKLLFAGMM
jgi:uncharacterized membrane protein YkvA (DUF1232 family)